MRRVISVYLPHWPTDRRTNPSQSDSKQPSSPSDAEPFVLAAADNRRRVVQAANREAEKQGVRVGIPVAMASALIAGLHIEEADAEDDRRALNRLAEWALRQYSPLVAADAPDGLMIDASGVAHLFGGEAGMLRHIEQQLARHGIEARTAMAPTYGAAHALARYGCLRPIVGRDVRNHLMPLPLAALRLGGETEEDLQALGFETIGELLNTPRAPLILRFGKALGLRLDQATGDTTEFLEPAPWRETLCVRRIFAEPIGTPESLAFTIQVLVDDLCSKLETAQDGARLLDLRFHRIDHRVETVRIGLARPTRTAKRLTRLLTDKLERVDPGLGVEQMILAAPWVEPLHAVQMASSFGAPPRPDLASLIDTLSNRLGEEKIWRAASVESDVPERSVIHVPPTSPPQACSWPAHWPRPPRLLSRPERIDPIALLPDYPPHSFTWRKANHRITRADGPERIFGEWWKRDAEFEAVRDYFMVEDEAGKRFWIYRLGDGVPPSPDSVRWYLHGFFG